MPSKASTPISRSSVGRRGRARLLAPLAVLAGLIWLGCIDGFPTAPEGIDEPTERASVLADADPSEAPDDFHGLSTVCRAMKRQLDEIRVALDEGATGNSTLQALAADLAKAISDTCG
jgi:hypothetical protein